MRIFKVSILLLMSVVFWASESCHLAKAESSANANEVLIKQLRTVCNEVIKAESYADFNNDGIVEAFFQTQFDDEDYSSNSIWYVTPSKVTCIYEFMPMFLLDLHTIDGCVMQTIEGRRYNEFWAVFNDEPARIDIVADFIVEEIYQDEETGVIYGVEWDWAESGERIFIHHLLKFDPLSFSFIDMHKSFVTY